jgi:hypothetical protein
MLRNRQHWRPVRRQHGRRSTTPPVDNTNSPADGGAVGRLLGADGGLGVVLGAQQRALGGKTSDRDAFGVGAPGPGRGRPWVAVLAPDHTAAGRSAAPTAPSRSPVAHLIPKSPHTGREVPTMLRRTLFRIAAVAGDIAAGVVALLAGAGAAYAAPPISQPPTAGPQVAGLPILAADSLPTIIGNITTWVTGLLIGVATLFLTIGGIRYLAAGGDPSEIEKAKSAVKSALVGYALAVLAPILLGVVQGWIGG